MRRDHEPTFLERGTRKAPSVPVYGSPKQVIRIRKLPVGRDDIPKISFSLDFTAADGRKPVTFEIPEATLNHVFGLEAIPLPTCSSETEGRYKRWRRRSIFGVAGLLSPLMISTPRSHPTDLWPAALPDDPS